MRRRRQRQLSYWTRIFQDEDEEEKEKEEEEKGERGGRRRQSNRQAGRETREEAAGRKWIFSFRRRNSPFWAEARRRLIVFMGNENGPLGEGINWKHRWKAPFPPSLSRRPLSFSSEYRPKNIRRSGCQCICPSPALMPRMQRKAASSRERMKEVIKTLVPTSCPARASGVAASGEGEGGGEVHCRDKLIRPSPDQREGGRTHSRM